jgi:transcriptional regulator with XRE-family HTH domain
MIATVVSMPRSLRVQQDCLDRVKLALKHNGFPSQRFLAEEVGFALATVSNFLTGKPVDYATFEELCQRLALDWREIADLDFEVSSQATDKTPEGPESSELIDELIDTDQDTLPSYPDGAVPLGSPFYLERAPLEAQVYQEIRKPGALVRIKAPKLMGKTSLMARILAQGQSLHYRTVYLDLSSVEGGIIRNLDKFLRWFCLMVGRQLTLENRIKDYWDTEILGSNDNCTVYFEEYLLPAIDHPLVLGLDNVDRVFPYPEVVEDFLGMLRSWHEKGKIAGQWKQLRLAMAHSTECYIPLDINQSPFNAGVPVELLEFDAKQVLSLASVHGLSWHESQVEELMRMVAGHPYLVRLALYEISAGKLTLEQLLRDAPTEVGIFGHHLRRQLEVLKQASGLAHALQKVVTSIEPVALDSMQIYKLHSMGLVQQQDNQVMPRCNLYREYFRRVLSA